MKNKISKKNKSVYMTKIDLILEKVKDYLLYFWNYNENKKLEKSHKDVAAWYHPAVRGGKLNEFGEIVKFNSKKLTNLALIEEIGRGEYNKLSDKTIKESCKEINVFPKRGEVAASKPKSKVVELLQDPHCDRLEFLPEDELIKEVRISLPADKGAVIDDGKWNVTKTFKGDILLKEVSVPIKPKGNNV